MSLKIFYVLKGIYHTERAIGLGVALGLISFASDLYSGINGIWMGRGVTRKEKGEWNG